MNSEQIKELLSKFREGRCTDDEKAMIEYWVHHLNNDNQTVLSEAELCDAEKQMWSHIKPVRSLSQKRYWSVAAAVLVFLSVGLTAGLYFSRANRNQVNKPTVVSNIKPGGNNAVLTLANGQKVNLNKASNGQIAAQSGIRISKQADGQISYTVIRNPNNANAGQTAYNTLETPRGGQYQLNLPDGSKVWLNAASSIRFPLTFNKEERLVELSGEGYFEVAHKTTAGGQRLPFIVRTILAGSRKSGQAVEVLGTHFNIDAYDDASTVKTTLLEGSVRVSQLTGGGKMQHLISKTLKPGQQSVLNNESIVVGQADTEAAVAWKNGYFRFNDESLESIMRKVAKWYNVDVVYQNESLKDEAFAGVITRFSNVTELLKMLELTGEVKFKIEGRRIKVLDKN